MKKYRPKDLAMSNPNNARHLRLHIRRYRGGGLLTSSVV